MKKIAICLFMALFLSLELNALTNEYYLEEEYLNLYTNQQKISLEFEKIVSQESKKITTKQTKPLKIVMIYPGNQISDYWRRSKDSFEGRLKELHINYELKDHFTKPATEISLQAKQILEALEQDTDYLIFTLDANKHKKFIDKIQSLKKPKLILQNITTPIKEFQANQPFLYVGFDHVKGSKMIADFYIKNSPKNSRYAVLYGSDGYVSDMRGKEFIKYISHKTEFGLIDTYYTNFDKQKAYSATMDLLNRHNNKVDFIYACSTDIALGAIDALKEKNLIGKIAINGWGGGDSELRAIEENLLDVTVMRMNDDNGVAMAEAIKLDIQNSSNLVPTIFSGEFKLIEKGIDKDKLQIYKSWAFRYSK